MFRSGHSIAKLSWKYVSRNVDKKTSTILIVICGTLSFPFVINKIPSNFLFWQPEMAEFSSEINNYGSQCMGKEAIIFFQHTCFTVQWGKWFLQIDFENLTVLILLLFNVSIHQLKLTLLLHYFQTLVLILWNWKYFWTVLSY